MAGEEEQPEAAAEQQQQLRSDLAEQLGIEPPEPGASAAFDKLTQLAEDMAREKGSWAIESLMISTDPAWVAALSEAMCEQEEEMANAPMMSGQKIEGREDSKG